MNGCISERVFNRYIDGSLDKKSRKALEDHIKTCDACRKEFESWKAVKEGLDGAFEISMPEGFKDKVMARVSKERVKPAAAGASVRRGLALVFVSLIFLYYITKPVLGSLVDRLFMDAFRALSENLFAFLDMIGIDPAVLIRLFGSFMANLNAIFPIFVASTILMIAGFFIIIVRGKMASNRI